MGAQCARPKVQQEYSFLEPEVAPDTNWKELKLEQEQFNMAVVERQEMERRVSEEVARLQESEKET